MIVAEWRGEMDRGGISILHADFLAACRRPTISVRCYYIAPSNPTPPQPQLPSPDPRSLVSGAELREESACLSASLK